MAAIDDASAMRPWLATAARWLRLAIAAAVCLWGVYVVAVQAFLWTPLLRHIINANEPTVHLEYRFAWSVWPGRVHLRALRLTSQDRGVQWQLDIDRVTTNLALLDLPRRIFHATRVEAEGLSFALRRRIPKPQLTPERLQGLPLIAGFDAAPIAEEGPDDDVPDWRYNLMSVWLQGVSATRVRSVWVDHVRVQGDAQVSGAFYLKPIRRVLIAPAQLSGSSLVLTKSGTKLLDPVGGSVTVWLGPFDPRGITPSKLAAVFGLEARGAGHVAGLDFLSQNAGSPVNGGAGPIRFALHVRDGRVLEGSEVAAEMHGASFRRGSLVTHVGRTALSLVVPENGGTASARLEAFDAVLKTRDGATGGSVELLGLALQGEGIDLSAPAAPRLASVEVRGGRIEDARAVFGALRIAGAQVDRGHGAFAVGLAGPPDRLSGWARVSVVATHLRADRLAIRADVAVDAKIHDFDPARGGDLSGTDVRIDEGRLADAGEQEGDPGWWARINLTRAALRLGPDGPLADADFSALCRDARPIVGLYVHRADLPGFVSGLFAMEGLRVRGSGALGNQLVVLRDLNAVGEGASIRALYLAEGSTKRGAALLTVGALSVGVGLDDSNGGVHVFGPGDWYASQEKRLRTGLPSPAPPPAPARSARRPAARRAK